MVHGGLTSCDCRVDIWAKEQKRRRKDQPASFWEQKAAAEKSLFRDPEFYKRLAEAALTAERVLLYTTGFQFDVYTGFSAVLAFRKALGEHTDPIVSDLFNETMIQVSRVATLSWSILRCHFPSSHSAAYHRTAAPLVSCMQLVCLSQMWGLLYHMQRQLLIVRCTESA